MLKICEIQKSQVFERLDSSISIFVEKKHSNRLFLWVRTANVERANNSFGRFTHQFVYSCRPVHKCQFSFSAQSRFCNHRRTFYPCHLVMWVRIVAHFIESKSVRSSEFVDVQKEFRFFVFKKRIFWTFFKFYFKIDTLLSIAARLLHQLKKHRAFFISVVDWEVL